MIRCNPVGKKDDDPKRPSKAKDIFELFEDEARSEANEEPVTYGGKVFPRVSMENFDYGQHFETEHLKILTDCNFTLDIDSFQLITNPVLQKVHGKMTAYDFTIEFKHSDSSVKKLAEGYVVGNIYLITHLQGSVY